MFQWPDSSLSFYVLFVTGVSLTILQPGLPVERGLPPEGAAPDWTPETKVNDKVNDSSVHTTTPVFT